jgi:hypothetical protein
VEDEAMMETRSAAMVSTNFLDKEKDEALK